MTTIKRRIGSDRKPTWVVTMFALAFVFSTGAVLAQTPVTTPMPGGTITRIPKWTAAAEIQDSVITELNNNIGIGATSPARLMHLRDVTSGVFTGARVSVAFDGSDPVYELLHDTVNKGFRWRLGNGISSDLYLDSTTNGFASYTPQLTVLNSGNVGIGTVSPWLKLNVWGGRAHVAAAGEPYAFGVGRTDAEGAFWLGASASANPDLILSNNGGVERLRVTDAGSVGIGTSSPAARLHVVGDVTLTGTGNITNSGNLTTTGTISGGNVVAKYQDLAEWVPANHAIPAGTVVTIDPENSNHVLASAHAYDTRVAGVVSARPGVILGEAGEGKVMVATTGRVRVKVDASTGPIRVGDLLVTSDKEGVAMRSKPLDLSGTPVHRPGTLIGKALEPLERGVGEILVLLSLQ